MKDRVTATIPQQKPFIKPETKLLYLGKVSWAKTTITGWAKFVVKPVIAYIIKDITDVLADDLNTTFKTVFKWNI